MQHISHTSAAERMRVKPRGNEFVFSIVALLVSFIIVQSVYALIIRPKAAMLMEQRLIEMQQGLRQTSLRSFYVIVKDYEQETAAILACWAIALTAFRAYAIVIDRRLLDVNFVEMSEDLVVLPADVASVSHRIEQVQPQANRKLLPRALTVALERFAATHSVHEAAEAMNSECETEAARLDTELSMLRFVAWGIPAVGFVGTVRGIGDAMQDAQRAAGGDISGVTLGLGIGFNSTLTALVLTIGVMFLLHQLQLSQDRLVLDTKAYVDKHLIRRLRVIDP